MNKSEWKHEWITVHGVIICHWCGVAKKYPFRKVNCEGITKITKEDGKLKVEYRK